MVALSEDSGRRHQESPYLAQGNAARQSERTGAERSFRRPPAGETQ